MKKAITIFSFFLFICFNTHLANASINRSRTFTQGIYKIESLDFSTGINYKVQNTCSSNKSLIVVFDSNQIIKQIVRLEPSSPLYVLKPFNTGDIILIIGAAQLEFS
ncbi:MULTISPECIES: hypothetical protein [unclassified Clostridium]|uniref:hypothetical protein n=1 Tax=unclassified Clostridium TaxID=2614128 RepID=UPI00029812B8|nr:MULTISPECIES: hypothetical protein [unclassified Clostridium]EKQ51582.1 MAG: hypothetical protein A370_04760 [Clostridium sp. Maddingley MBC34-26]